MAQQLATVGRFTNAMYRVGAVTGVISVASGLAYYLAYYKPRQKVFNKINNLSPEFFKEQNDRLKRYGLSAGGPPPIPDSVIENIKKNLSQTPVEKLKIAARGALTYDLLKASGAEENVLQEYMELVVNCDKKALDSIDRELGLDKEFSDASWTTIAQNMKELKGASKGQFDMFIARLNNKECLKPTNEEVKAGLARVKAGEEYADVIRDMVRTKRKEVQEKEMAAQQ
ncbi:uncharacterized protein LOC128214427 [Mya arenaria]|uniref:uncharacterized protein LOC128214427 n=1 Tax=Mya arenaria TaxID=6604 RepID=UPI0022E5CF9D|nr:uncharacterized protein LOC128214427 [Mya arenaria]